LRDALFVSDVLFCVQHVTDSGHRINDRNNPVALYTDAALTVTEVKDGFSRMRGLFSVSSCGLNPCFQGLKPIHILRMGRKAKSDHDQKCA
jgi:hypothetical protein